MGIDSYVSGAIFIAVCSAISGLGLLGLRRRYDLRSLEQVQDVAGQFLAVAGTMYAVLLGLIVVDAMARFQKAVFVVEEEANSLSNIVYLGDCAPRERRDAIREGVTRYVRLVIDREWGSMAAGRYDPECRRLALALMRTLRDWEPATEREKGAYPALLGAAEDLWNNRRERTVICSAGIPALEWAVILIGGVLTIGFTYVFVLHNLKLQLALTGLLAMIIALNIFLVLMFGYPFSGDLRVSPESFRVVLEVVEAERAYEKAP